MLLTRKIQLAFDLGNREGQEKKDENNRLWQAIRELNNSCFRAANKIVSGQYIITQLNSILFENENKSSFKDEKRMRNELGKIKDKKEKKRMEDEYEKFKEEKKKKRNEIRMQIDELLCAKNKTATNWEAEKMFPDIPYNVRNILNNEVTKYYQKEIKDVMAGKRTLRTYRDVFPIPIDKEFVTFSKKENEILFSVLLRWNGGKTAQLPFKMIFGKDLNRNDENNRAVVEGIMDGKYKMSSSSIQLLDNKIYLLLCVDCN